MSLLVLGGGGYIAKKTLFDKPAPTPTPTPNSGINYDPPTEEDLKETEQKKDQIAKDLNESGKPTPQPTQTPGATDSPASKKQATVIVTYVGQYNDAKDLEVGAYVENVFEEGGDCTLSVSGPSGTVTKKTKGVRDVSKTLCPAFTVPRSELSAGTWSVIVSYESSAAAGSSSAQEVSIQ